MRHQLLVAEQQFGIYSPQRQQRPFANFCMNQQIPESTIQSFVKSSKSQRLTYKNFESNITSFRGEFTRTLVTQSSSPQDVPTKYPPLQCWVNCRFVI